MTRPSRRRARLRPLRAALAVLLLCGGMAAPGPLAAQEAERPRVVILTTGGTIASTPGDMLPGEELVAAVPALLDHARIEVEEVFRIGSSGMTPAHWIRLARRIDALLAGDPGLAGVVVTHGTDTMEETAFFLNLTVADPRPVVLTGSMRGAGSLSADGPRNLLDAVRVAATPEARGKGVLVVLNEVVAAGRDVRKTHDRSVATFASPEWGFLGRVEPDTVLFHRAPLRPHTTATPFRVDGLDDLPNVGLVVDYAGADGSAVRDAAARRPDGLVVVSFAGGRMSPGTRGALAEVVDSGLPVVVASREEEGRIDAPGEGALVAPDLPGHKARILLALALTTTRDHAGLDRILRRY